MNVLTLDIGNSSIKAGVFQDDQLQAWERFQAPELEGGALPAWAARFDVDTIAYTNVGAGAGPLTSWLGELASKPSEAIAGTSPTPFIVNYATPSTLGADRLAAVAAVHRLAESFPALVIDVGTAITFDYLDEHGVYRGGSISPGIRLRYRALHEFTNSLPQLDPAPNAPLVGKHTAGSIHAGVIHGIRAELEGMIQNYRELSRAPLRTYLTGGDAPAFEKALKNVNFATPHLVLHGIYALYHHQTTLA